MATFTGKFLELAPPAQFEPVHRLSAFSKDELKALKNALDEYNPVFSNGKLWDEVAVAAMSVHDEIKGFLKL